LASTQEDFSTISWSVPFAITLVVLSLIGTSAAFALWFSLLRLASLSKLNVFTFLTPIFGLVIGSVFFAEKIQPIALAGIGLSLLGIFWVSRRLTSGS
jgi:drug/metabolite transporter (DMT)-like permease